MKNFPPYGSHLPVLCRAFTELKKSTGNVLELGCGDWSTPFFHELCVDRNLVTLDNDEAWINQFLNLRTPKHIIRAVSSWENLLEYNMDWDIVFIDHAPAPYRGIALEKMANKSKLLIAHDTESTDTPYGYQKVMGCFKFFIEYPWNTTKTGVFSNIIDVRNWW